MRMTAEEICSIMNIELLTPEQLRTYHNEKEAEERVDKVFENLGLAFRAALIIGLIILNDVNAFIDEDRAIQILKYSLWDVERSILEMPATWRYLYLEEKGSLPADDEAIARRIYDYAVKKK